jgi:hypothetical protein
MAESNGSIVPSEGAQPRSTDWFPCCFYTAMAL